MLEPLVTLCPERLKSNDQKDLQKKLQIQNSVIHLLHTKIIE